MKSVMHRFLLPLFFLTLFLAFSYAAPGLSATSENADGSPDAVGQHADLSTTPQHGVAMHGTPKYDPDFRHFDYVNPEAPQGGALRLHMVGTFDSLNPFIVKGTPAAGMAFLGAGLVYESLMDQSYDEPFTMYGLLAESIELPESRRWVAFNLREQARWADGAPVTAHDVVWTFNTLLEKGTPFFKAYYGDVQTVKATSDKRVLFTFTNGENAELPLVISQMSVLPKHYWEAADNDFANTSLVPPLGSGPYAINDVDPGRYVEYKKRNDWWGTDLPLYQGRYNFDRVTYDYYRDSNVALEAFFAGEYDVRQENTAKLWAQAYNAPAVKAGDIIKEEIPHERPQGMQGFIYNTRRDIFKDPLVREALAYAFDFEWSNEQFAYGAYKRSRSYFENSELESSGLPEDRELEILELFRDRLPDRVFTEEYNPPSTAAGRQAIRRNLRHAIGLLDAAGYVTGPDGFRVHKDTGTALSFEIIDNNPSFERWVLPFIQNLAKIGVRAEFRIVDGAQYQNRMTSFDYDMTVMSFGQSSSPGNEQRDYWGSEKAGMPGSRNYIGVSDPVVDELIEMIIQAPSREELVHRTKALDRVLQWGFYLIPQWHIDHWRIAWWDKLTHPETLSPITPAITDTWWVRRDQPF